MNVTAELAALEARIARTCARFDGPGDGGQIEPAPAGAVPFAAAIQRCAREQGLDPALVAAVVRVESGFDPRATSPAGAAGLMQLMPATALSLGVRDAYDPLQNLAGGSRYLRSLVDRFRGDLPRSLAAYNAGADAVRRYGGIPPYAETRRYVSDVLSAFRQYELHARRNAPP
jgi:soluble lytic murein transglycosylase-like protein